MKKVGVAKESKAIAIEYIRYCLRPTSRRYEAEINNSKAAGLILRSWISVLSDSEQRKTTDSG